MAKQRGRKATNRTKLLRVRLTPTELAHLRRCAEIRNVTVSEYARLALLLGRLT